MRTTDTEKPEPTQNANHSENLKAAMASAFQFGFLCHEKGMNMEAALAKFYETMKG